MTLNHKSSNLERGSEITGAKARFTEEEPAAQERRQDSVPQRAPGTGQAAPQAWLPPPPPSAPALALRGSAASRGGRALNLLRGQRREQSQTRGAPPLPLTVNWTVCTSWGASSRTPGDALRPAHTTSEGL